jgi:integrase
MNFSTATSNYIESLTEPRRRGALSPNSIRLYTFHANRLAFHFGPVDLADIKNGRVKEYIRALQDEQLSASTIAGIYSVLRQIVSSVRNEDGEQLYTQKFDADFLNLPIVKLTAQPCSTSAEVQRSFSTPNSPIVPFLAATGLRVSEALSLEIAGTGNSYDPATGTVHLRVALKTPAAARSVLLTSDFRTWFNTRIPANDRLFPRTYQQVHDALAKANLTNAHAFRRFRITHLRKAGMNESVLRRQVGHSDPGVTSRYDRSGTDHAFVRAQVESAGIGFTLPNEEKEKAA